MEHYPPPDPLLAIASTGQRADLPLALAMLLFVCDTETCFGVLPPAKSYICPADSLWGGPRLWRQPLLLLEVATLRVGSSLVQDVSFKLFLALPNEAM